MKNIRAYLTTAVVSLMLVVVSAFLLADADGQTALGVPLLFGFVFSWSAVRAVIAQMEENDTAADALTLSLRAPRPRES